MAPARSGERLALARGGNECSQSGEAVGGDEPEPCQLAQCLLELGRPQPRSGSQLMKEGSTTLVQDILNCCGITRELVGRVILVRQPFRRVLSQEQRNRSRSDGTPRPTVGRAGRSSPGHSSHHAERVQQRWVVLLASG